MPTKRHIRTRFLITAFAVLLGTTLWSALQHYRQNEQRQLDRLLTFELDTQVSTLENYFERSRAVNLVLAQNPAFRDYYRSGPISGPPTAAIVDPAVALSEQHEHDDDHNEHGHHLDEVEAVGALAEINLALAQLQEIYPNSIVETCFIDIRGWENARVVRGEFASADELSLDETGADFFQSTIDSGSGSVHQARPYISPDTDELVISNSTLVETEGGGAIVHFEVTIDSFLQNAHSDGTMRTRIIDRSTGAVIIDTHSNSQPVAAHFDVKDIPHDQAVSAVANGSSTMLERLTPTEDNANDWVVMTSSPQSSGYGLGIGPRESILTLLLAAVVSRLAARYRRRHLHLVEEAGTDPLTGLANRRRLSERLDRLNRQRAEVSVLAIDLNRFKEINDMFGHDVGDEMLCCVAERLRAVVRADDLVVRLGGDEFAICVEAGQQRARELAERVAESISEPITLERTRLQVTASIGMSSAPHDVEGAGGLLVLADMAMYEAKRHRREFVEYQAEHNPDNARRLAMSTRLREAIQSETLDVHFQPQIDALTREVVGLEALARWTDSELGSVPPDEFIPLAEDLDMINDLTRVVLKKSLDLTQQLASVHRAVPMSVNVSARSLFDTSFVSVVRTELETHKLDPRLLQIELTEGLLVGDSTQELETLHELRSLGCTISVDDFGTGHSSLGYLSRLPIDELKIDKSFVLGLLDDPASGFIIRSAVDLAHNLGLHIVAEGVETAEHLAAVATLGCDRAQGWHIAKALAPDEITSWLADWSSEAPVPG